MARVELVAYDDRPRPSAADLAATRAERLDRDHGALPTADLIDLVAHRLFPGKVAVVSSFGADAAVLLDLVAQVDPRLPVLFVDTDKLFGETLRHRDRLVERLGLTDVRTISPDSRAVAEADPLGVLWHADADACCHVRKVVPLARAVGEFDAWISGRKRFQAATRAGIPTFEADGRRIKINPLARWSAEDLAARATARDLPAHPLVERGFGSIGCMPCTSRIAPGEDARAGRWRGSDKTECGIHLGLAATTEQDGSGI
jgi:phosphoadenosine phosphosulfate reductase